MIKAPMYHGTSYKIDYWEFDKIGTGEGNSTFPGIYFTPNPQEALRYAELSSQKTGQSPRVYVAELEIKDYYTLNFNRELPVKRYQLKGFIWDYFNEWFDNKNNEILTDKKGYIEEKFSTLYGQLSLIDFAARKNKISPIEVMHSLGWRAAIDGDHVIVTEPDQILSFEELGESGATEDLAEDLDYWAQGGYSYKNAFDKESREFIKSHLEIFSQSLYRVEDADLNLDILENSTKSFLRPSSFCKDIEAIKRIAIDKMEFNGEPLIIFKTSGPVKAFDVQKYLPEGHYYQYQKEVLVTGKFIITGTETMSIQNKEIPVIEISAQQNNLQAYEALSERYLVDSKNAKKYKTMPGNRYKRRMMIRQNGGNRVWYDIDVNRFFKNDEFRFHIPVIGETDDYVVGFQIKNWLPVLKYDIKNEGFSVQTFKKSLSKAMRTLDIKWECNCADAKYRMNYWASQKGDKLGEQELRPSKITNPNDDLGRGCKHCLTGDTLVETLDGKKQSIIELKDRFENGENLWVYSVNEKGDFVPGKILNVFETKKTDELLEIELDNGKKIKCTPDHRFMLRDGTWSDAKSLTIGQSMMPFYRHDGQNGYETFVENSTGICKSIYKRVAEVCYPGEIAKKREEASLAHWARVIENMTEDEYIDMHKRKGETNHKNHLLGFHKNTREITENQKQKYADRMVEMNKNPDIIKKIQLSKIRRCLLETASSGPLTEDRFEQIRKKKRGYPRIYKYFDSFNNAVSYFQINHKIIRINYLSVKDIPVYDLTVENWHNFVVEDSIVAHNCLFLLSNKLWVERVARIIFNYCLNLYKQNKRLFELTIGKRLELTDDMVENRPIQKRKPKTQETQKPEEVKSDSEQTREPTNSSEGSPVAEEAYNDLYADSTAFDEDQQMMIDLALEEGVDVSEYITPKNTPDQIWEVTRSIQSQLPESIIYKLSNPVLNPLEIQVLREAYLDGIDLFNFIGYDVDVLKQLKLGIKQGIDPKELVTHGMNHRQIEQLRVAYNLDKALFNELKQSKLNYEGMRKRIAEWRMKHA